MTKKRCKNEKCGWYNDQFQCGCELWTCLSVPKCKKSIIDKKSENNA